MVTWNFFDRHGRGEAELKGTALKCEKPGKNVLRNVVKLKISSWLELGKYIAVKPFLGLF